MSSTRFSYGFSLDSSEVSSHWSRPNFPLTFHVPAALSTVGGIFIVIVFSFPLSLVAIIPMAILYRAIMRYYLATSREIKRLDAVSK